MQVKDANIASAKHLFLIYCYFVFSAVVNFFLCLFLFFFRKSDGKDTD